MHKPTFTLAFAVTLALGATACKGKVEQCNAFIDRANQSQTAIATMNFESEDTKKLEADAAKVEAEAQAVEAVSLKDEKLKGFQSAYGKNLKELAANVRQLSKLHADIESGKASEAQVKKLEADDQRMQQELSKVIDDINKYCSGS